MKSMPQSQKGIVLIPIIIGSVIVLLIGIIAATASNPQSQKALQKGYEEGQKAAKNQSGQESGKQGSETTNQKSNISPSPTPQTKGVQTKILTVIDGDTIEVLIDNKKEVVRLIGINSPETVDPRKPVECFGKEASAKAKSILLGKSVQLEADPTQDDRDKYQRLLRYVFLEDGTNFSKLMISEGYAYEYTYNTPYKYQSEFKQAQKEAEASKVGLWADSACLTNTTQPSSTTGFPGGSSEGSSGFTCSVKKTCPQMTNCAEAQFYLNTCGVKSLDRDGDGVPCETICKK